MTHSALNAKRWALPAVVVAMLLGGCSTVQLRGVPANRLPRWLLGEPRANRQPINLIRLRQDPPAVYQLGPRDILGIYIQGVLGNDEEPPPVHFPTEGTMAPALGYPIPIREDGTLALPLLPAPLKVSGMTLSQAEAAIKEEYIRNGILAVGRDRIIVTIIRKRTYQVLVVREDVGSQQAAQGVILAGPSKRGSAFAVDLNAYENDVMHALAETGGMPGLDAKNEILILRGTFADAQSRSGIIDDMINAGPYNGSDYMQRRNPNVIRIPLRSEPGRPLQQLTEDDIILATGDVIFIETRERDVFYTGGLLQGREIPLPRDYDLDVLSAISLAGGTVASGVTQGSLARNTGAIGGGGSAGIVPATQIIIVRKLPDGSTIPIKINLNRALVDPSQRILVQPGDLVLLQYTALELAANVVLGSVSFSYFLNQIN